MKGSRESEENIIQTSYIYPSAPSRYGMWQQQQQQQQQTYLWGLSSQYPQQRVVHPAITDADNVHEHQHHQYHHRATIMNLPMPSNPRASRNLAEKQRRDNLNTNISTMAALVPTVAGSSRRMDKISILRLAAAFLRTQFTLGRSSTNYFPPQLNDFDLEQYFVDHLVGSGGFFLIVTIKGKIVYVSRQVEQHLGHVQNELLGQLLYNFVCFGDHNTLMKNLTPDGMKPIYPFQNGIGEIMVGSSSELTHDNSSNSSEDSATTQGISERPKTFCEQRRSFHIRMSQRTVSKREQPQYQRFDISGVLRLAEACKNSDFNNGKKVNTTNDIVFAGVATLPKKRPITELSILDATKSEYVTRHLLDGHIIYCDHRVSVVAGYMSEEVTGANAFKFMHKDDSKWTILGLRQMYDGYDSFGTSCYRLLTKTGNYIYLQTRGYLEYDKETQKMISFICINTLVSENEGIKLMQEMKEKFSTANGASKFLQEGDNVNSPVSSSASPLSSSKSDIEDSTLEDYIAYLIDGLSSPIISDDHFGPHSPTLDIQYARAAALSSCIPPRITQGNNRLCGNDRNHHYSRYLRDKELRMQVKQEYKEHRYTSSDKLLSPGDARRSPVSDAEDVKPLNGFTSDDVNVVGHSSSSSRRNNIRAATYVQSTVFVTRKPKSRRSHGSYTACLDGVVQNANVPDLQRRVDYVNANVLSSSGVLYGEVTGNIKMEPGVGFICMDKQSSVLHYFGDGDDAAGIKTHERWPLKRICSEEDLLALHSKKKPGEADAYASTSACDERQDYRSSFAAENQYPRSLAVEFSNQRNGISAQQLVTTAESPTGLGPSEAGDYQQLMEPAATPLEAANPELGLLDLANLKQDLLLSSDLEADPELMMKIFDTLNNGSTTNLDDNSVKANVQQLVPNDQAVNDEIRRTYHQLANSMALRESQINVLARDLENPALCAQRKNLSQLQAEHNIQKQMLKTLQQDHRKIQVNVAKQNVEV